MRCPHCHGERSRVTETRKVCDDVHRLHLCRDCGSSFRSIQSVFVWRGRGVGWVRPPAPPRPIAAAPAPEEADIAKPAARGAPRRRFMPDSVPDELHIPPQVAALLLIWWKESRLSKHGSRAVWTELAWRSSVKRVAAMRPADQLRLVEAAVENGWQGIQASYLEGLPAARPVAAAGAGPLPSDPRMVAALRAVHHQEEPWSA